MQLVEVSVTDARKYSFTFQENITLIRPEIEPNSFNFTSPISALIGGDGTDSLSMANVIYELNIDIVSQKSPAIHYDGQHHDYAFGGYTYYYSRTRMLGTG